MNALGHAYIANKVVGTLNELVIIGSHINDLVPFIENSVFSFEEIHESPDKIYYFTKEKYPELTDFAVAMLTHSVKFGADKYNREIDSWLLKDNKSTENKLVEMIMDCSGVSEKVAREYRLHNYLWTGVEMYILKNQNDFVKYIETFDLKSYVNVVSKLLAECFNKEYSLVLKDVNYATNTLSEFKIYTLEGILNLWKKAMGGLPEKDVVDLGKTRNVFRFIFSSFDNKWEEILNYVEREVNIRVKTFLNS